MKILVAEDQKELRMIITNFLKASNYEVQACKDGIEALDAFVKEDFDLALLDIMMPHMDGFELCKRIKELKDIPIIFLTAKIMEADQLKAYELGCDDYIMKPFSLPVLKAKIQAVMKRNYQPTTIIGPFTIDHANKVILLDKQPLDLVLLDYKLLVYLLQHPSRLLTREQIINHVFGYDYEGSNRNVDVHIKNIRKSLGDKHSYIVTVMKQGYRFELGEDQ